MLAGFIANRLKIVLLKENETMIWHETGDVRYVSESKGYEPTVTGYTIPSWFYITMEWRSLISSEEWCYAIEYVWNVQDKIYENYSR